MKIALAQLNFTVGDIKSNTEKIITAIDNAKHAGADLIVFAEFAISGTPAYGLLTKTTFLTLCEEAVEEIASKCCGIAAIVGTPYLTAEGPISAAAYIDAEGNIEYIGKRYVTARREMGYIVGSSIGSQTIHIKDTVLKVVVGDDLSRMEDLDEEIDAIISVNARRYGKGILSRRLDKMSRLAFAEGRNLILVNQVGGSGDIVYDGTSGILNSDGRLVMLLKSFDEDMRKAVLLAEKLGVHQINTFSGCPGDCEDSKYPNWVTCPWPNDFGDILDYQWNQVLIPYWKEFVEFSKAHGVDKIALELHPGFCVYNTESLLKLREAVGPEIGANLDLSHLIWQGMDPIAVIRALGKAGAIFHFHAKDTKVDALNTGVNGVLDTKSYADEINRSWIFRSVGYGNGETYWRDVISNLRMVGYDYAISIEHEDSLMCQNEGLEKAVELLKKCLIKEGLTEAWWI